MDHPVVLSILLLEQSEYGEIIVYNLNIWKHRGGRLRLLQQFKILDFFSIFWLLVLCEIWL